MYVAAAAAAAELLTCSSDPPDAKKSPAREKATAVAGPCHTTPQTYIQQLQLQQRS